MLMVILTLTHTHTLSEFVGELTYQTDMNKKDLFNRTFSTDQYMYCKSCKTLVFTECNPVNDSCRPCVTTHNNKTNTNGTLCSRVDVREIILYPGDFNTSNPSSE